MGERIYTESQVEDAMCLWEAFMALRSSGSDGVKEKLEALFDEHGTAFLRYMMIELIEDVGEAWKAANALDDQGCFDWDFCPAWLAGLIEGGGIDQYVERMYQTR